MNAYNMNYFGNDWMNELINEWINKKKMKEWIN